MNIYYPQDLPENLLDVVVRLLSGGLVYAFELDLLANFVSQ
mgnify:CR=1 FL=1